MMNWDRGQAKTRAKAPGSRRRAITTCIAFLTVGGVVVLLGILSTEPKGVPILPSEFWDRAEAGDLRGVLVITDSDIRGGMMLRRGDKVPTPFYVRYEWRDDGGFVDRLEEALNQSEKHGGTGTYRFDHASWGERLVLPLLLVLALVTLLWVLLMRRLRGASADAVMGKVGPSRHRTVAKGQVRSRFEQLAGLEEAKAALAGVVGFLRDPEPFRRVGATLPHGVLLIGEVGCGKTTLGQAIAGEAGVALLYIASCDFVEVFVGVGAARVHGLFKQARALAPCVVFLDDLRAIAERTPPGGDSREHDERRQTLLALLAEMDALGPDDAVVVVAATRAGIVLDPAITHGGRFGKQVVLPLPAEPARLAILRRHADMVRCGPDVDLAAIAAKAEGFSGARLRVVVNEASIAAALAGREAVEQADLEAALAAAAARPPRTAAP